MQVYWVIYPLAWNCISEKVYKCDYIPGHLSAPQKVGSLAGRTVKTLIPSTGSVITDLDAEGRGPRANLLDKAWLHCALIHYEISWREGKYIKCAKDMKLPTVGKSIWQNLDLRFPNRVPKCKSTSPTERGLSFAHILVFKDPVHCAPPVRCRGGQTTMYEMKRRVMTCVSEAVAAAGAAASRLSCLGRLGALLLSVARPRQPTGYLHIGNFQTLLHSKLSS